MKKLNALVTGASSGIGKVFAEELAGAGYDLIITARREELLKKLKDELEKKYHVSVEYFKADLSDINDVKKVGEAFPDVDLLVNNAGMGMFGSFLKTDISRGLHLIDLNVKALYYLTKVYGERMALKKRGGIINVASLAGFKPYTNIAVYSASKAFVISLTQAAGEELKKHGVQVMTLCPGSTATEFFMASTGGTQSGNFFRAGGVLKPEKVVKEALKAFKKGKRISVPGTLNKFLKVLTGFMPDGFFLRMVHSFLKSED